MVFHWSLSDSKSPQVSRTLLSILAIIIIIIIIIIISPLLASSSHQRLQVFFFFFLGLQDSSQYSSPYIPINVFFFSWFFSWWDIFISSFISSFFSFFIKIVTHFSILDSIPVSCLRHSDSFSFGGKILISLNLRLTLLVIWWFS